jgi:hypothetical protein
MVIVGILLFVAGSITICILTDGSIGGLLASLSLASGTVFLTVLANDGPSAIDVYRGKTTLEITSVNGVPTDTVVVYKKK